MLARISQKIYSISTLFSKNDDIIDTDEKKRYLLLIIQVEEVKQQLQKLENFIKSKPDLEKMCIEYIQIDFDGIAIPKKIASEDFDQNNPIDQITLLELQHNHLKFQLNEQILFIKRNREIYNLFEEYVLEEKNKQKNNDFVNPQKNAQVFLLGDVN